MSEFNAYNKPVKHPVFFVPCSINDKIKVYISQEPGESEYTTGVVQSLDDYQTPVIKYKDLSHLKLSEFDRLILQKDVIMIGRYKVHEAWPRKKEVVVETI